MATNRIGGETGSARPTCLYCCEAKARELFNAEHVMPRSFGTFENNFVLRDAVCKQCNDYFSKHLEIPLGRDSMEGLERFSSEVASPSGMHRFGRRHMRCRWNGGACDGAILEWRPCGDQLKVHLIDQIGCSPSPTGTFEWYRLSEFPDRETLLASGLIKGSSYFKICGESPDVHEQAAALLNARGYDVDPAGTLRTIEMDADGGVPIHIEGAIDRTLMRAVSKIAFNYFAYHYPALARMEAFAEIKRFVRYGDWGLKSPVEISPRSILGGIPEDRQLLAHVVAVSWQPTRQLMAQLSLFSWMQYQIVLADDFISEPTSVEMGHIFDPINRTIVRIARASGEVPTHRVPPMVERARRAGGIIQ